MTICVFQLNYFNLQNIKSHYSPKSYGNTWCMAWQFGFSQNLTKILIGLKGCRLVNRSDSPRCPGWPRSLESVLLHSPQVVHEGASEEGHPLTSI